MSTRRVKKAGKDAPEEDPKPRLVHLMEENQNDPWVTYVIDLIWEHGKMTAALESISNHEGKVCVNFDTCKHKGCNSSYASWSIADETLKEIMEYRQTH
jgi:hypothetical protein